MRVNIKFTPTLKSLKTLYIDNWFVERENRTDCLILFILWKVMPICGEAIKQAIAAEEWEY